MKLLLLGSILILFSPMIAAQDLGAFNEATAGNFFGMGARQMSMGGTGIASSWDGAALYYNPASLARIHRIEFQAGIAHQKFSNKTSLPPNRYEDFTSALSNSSIDLSKTRLGSINLTVPVPTYRGSLVLAFGINQVLSFDRTALYNTIDRNLSGLSLENYGKEYEIGSIYLYSAGAGIDISPKLSVGLSLNVYSGSREIAYEYSYSDETNDYYGDLERRIDEDYIGVSAKGGLLARPNENLSIGITVETPLDYQVEYIFDSSYVIDYLNELYYDNDQYLVEYDLSRPFIFGAGFAYRFSKFTVSGDAEYIDWSQLSYNDNPAMGLENDSLSLLYRDVLNLRGGVEYQFPTAGLAVRAGLFSTPLPYQKDFISDDRFGYSLGAGWLIDKVLMLDAAFVHGSLDRRFTFRNPFLEAGEDIISTAIADDSFSRLFVTVSYRY